MIKTIDEIEIAGKRVLIRVDFNVPLKSEQAPEGGEYLVVGDDT